MGAHAHAHAQTETEHSPFPGLEVADIFRAYGEAFRQLNRLTPSELRAMTDIESCRTAVLGGHLDLCDTCDFSRPAYNSCRNRHCPKCQSLNQALWIEKRLERVLPVKYFHVVFTLPSELRALTWHNPKQMYGLLFEAATRTLLTLGEDKKRLGAQLGVTTVLHTWTRKLSYHPHMHCIVTGGGLTKGEEPEWVSVKGRYLFPKDVMAELFRGKFLGLLCEARTRGELNYGGACQSLKDDTAFSTFKDKLYKMKWVVYAKQPFGGAQQVISYLGRYTHRVGISNQRLVSMDERGVTFRTKDGDTVTLAPFEFIRRWLNHVLPSGFVKIRHFGLHASSNVNTRLLFAQTLLTSQTPGAVQGPLVLLPELPEWAKLLTRLTGKDVLKCPACKTGRLERHPLPEGRAPP